MSHQNQSENYQNNNPEEDVQETSELLRSIADAIDNNQIDNVHMEYVQHFCRTYRTTEIILSNDYEDLIKFLILGWYIYTIGGSISSR